jgi:hypothetical protein
LRCGILYHGGRPWTRLHNEWLRSRWLAQPSNPLAFDTAYDAMLAAVGRRDRLDEAIRYLDQFDGAPNTLTLYRGYVRKHISPFLGHLEVGEVDADVLDSFYAERRRCRDRPHHQPRPSRIRSRRRRRRRRGS